MTRINVYDIDEDTREQYLAGWYDDDRLTESIKEGERWDGNNRRGIVSGLQIGREWLMRTASGRWVVERDARNDFNGSLSRDFVTDGQAREWLLRNGSDEIIRKYWGPLEDEGAGLEQLGQEIKDLERRLAVRKAEARKLLTQLRVGQGGGLGKSEAAGRLQVSRTTLDSWLKGATRDE